MTCNRLVSDTSTWTCAPNFSLASQHHISESQNYPCLLTFIYSFTSCVLFTSFTICVALGICDPVLRQNPSSQGSHSLVRKLIQNKNMYTDYGSLWLPVGWGPEGIKASLSGSDISLSYWREKEILFQQSEYYMQIYMCQSFGIIWHTWAYLGFSEQTHVTGV